MYLARELTDEGLPVDRPQLRRPQPHHRASRAPQGGGRRPRGRAHPPAGRGAPLVPVRTICRPDRLTQSHRYPRLGEQMEAALQSPEITDTHKSTAPTTSNRMKLSCSRESFLSRLGVAVRGVSTRSAIQALSGVLIRADAGGVELQATDMELGIRIKVDAKVESRGHGGPAGAASARRHPLAARRTTCRSSTARASRTSRSSRVGALPPAHPSARGLPEAARGRRQRAHRGPGRGVRGDDRARGPRGLERRDPAAPHRRARVGLRRRAADGGHRLLPAERQGDEARTALAATWRRTCRPGPFRSWPRRRDDGAERSASPPSRTRSCSAPAKSSCPRGWSKVDSRTTSSSARGLRA